MGKWSVEAQNLQISDLVGVIVHRVCLSYHLGIRYGILTF